MLEYLLNIVVSSHYLWIYKLFFSIYVFSNWQQTLRCHIYCRHKWHNSMFFEHIRDVIMISVSIFTGFCSSFCLSWRKFMSTVLICQSFSVFFVCWFEDCERWDNFRFSLVWCLYFTVWLRKSLCLFYIL